MSIGGYYRWIRRSRTTKGAVKDTDFRGCFCEETKNKIGIEINIGIGIVDRIKLWFVCSIRVMPKLKRMLQNLKFRLVVSIASRFIWIPDFRRSPSIEPDQFSSVGEIPRRNFDCNPSDSSSSSEQLDRRWLIIVQNGISESVCLSNGIQNYWTSMKNLQLNFFPDELERSFRSSKFLCAKFAILINWIIIQFIIQLSWL